MESRASKKRKEKKRKNGYEHRINEEKQIQWSRGLNRETAFKLETIDTMTYWGGGAEMTKDRNRDRVTRG